jgi:hypothetical protein
MQPQKCLSAFCEECGVGSWGSKVISMAGGAAEAYKYTVGAGVCDPHWLLLGVINLLLIVIQSTVLVG